MKSVPTLFLVINGEMVERINGAPQEKDLDAFIKLGTNKLDSQEEKKN